MKRLKLILLAGLCFAVVNGCNYSNDIWHPRELPEITSSGLNSFGCKLNGEIFQDRWSVYDPVPVEATHYGGSIIIIARDSYYGLKITLQISGDSLDDFSWGEKRHYLTDSSYYFLTEILSDDPPFETNRDLVFGDSAYIDLIRFDSTSRIMAGTFQFDALTKEGDTVEVRDGRFDVYLWSN